MGYPWKESWLNFPIIQAVPSVGQISYQCNFHLFTKFASCKVPPVMASTHGSVVPLAMFSLFFYKIGLKIVQQFWNAMREWTGKAVTPLMKELLMVSVFHTMCIVQSRAIDGHWELMGTGGVGPPTGWQQLVGGTLLITHPCYHHTAHTFLNLGSRIPTSYIYGDDCK